MSFYQYEVISIFIQNQVFLSKIPTFLVADVHIVQINTLPWIKKVYLVATQNNIKTIIRQGAPTFNASFYIWVRILWEIHSCNETVYCSPCGAYFTFFRSRCIFSEIMNDLFEWPKSDNGFVDSLIQIYWNKLRSAITTRSEP